MVVAVVVAVFLSLVSIVRMEPFVSTSKGLRRSRHRGPDISVESRQYVGFDFILVKATQILCIVPSPYDCLDRQHTLSDDLDSQKHPDYYVKTRLKRSFDRASPDAQPITQNESCLLSM